MACQGRLSNFDSANLAQYQPVVCLEKIDCGKLREAVVQSFGALKWNNLEIGTKKALANILSPPRLHQPNFQLNRRQSQSVAPMMGRHARTTPADNPVPIADVEKKTVARKAEAKGAATGRSLRSSNIMNIPPVLRQDVPTPSPPSTPTTRSRSLGRPSVANGTTRRLLPVAAPPKTCPRILRQTPQRSRGIAAYQEESASGRSASLSSSYDESSDSSPMCSPRKKSAMTPPTKAQKATKNDENATSPVSRTTRSGRTPNARNANAAKNDDDAEAPVVMPTRSGRTPSTRKSVAVAVEATPKSASRRAKASTKPVDASDAPPVRRRGRPLLKTGTNAKAVKTALNTSPTTLDDSSADDGDNEMDTQDSLLTSAISRLHVSKEEFSRQVVASSRSSNWAPLGREQEAHEIFNFVSEHLKSGTSGSLFVAGVPGIGKSATIGAVLERLAAFSQGSGNKSADLPRFRLVTVNGFHFATPVRFYCEVHRQLLKASSTSSTSASKGSKAASLTKAAQQKLKQRSLGPKAALDTLNGYFTGKSTLGSLLPTVLVVDELDALVSATSGNQVAFGTAGQNTARRTTNFGANRVLYNLLEWASTPVSRLVIVAVANTLDLPERALPLRVVSRLGLHRLAFMPYTHLQLESIVRARLASLPSPVFDSPDAILLAARKVAMASGDARRVLELCRLAVERAMRQSRPKASMQDVVAASDSLSSATSRLALVRQVAISWRRVLTALVNVCRMQCRDHGACLVRELHAELTEMWREEGGFSRPSDVEAIRIVGQLVACGLLAAEDVSHLGIQAYVQLTMPLPDLAAILASLLGTT